jgi:hypothetical protein
MIQRLQKLVDLIPSAIVRSHNQGFSSSEVFSQALQIKVISSDPSLL